MNAKKVSEYFMMTVLAPFALQLHTHRRLFVLLSPTLLVHEIQEFIQSYSLSDQQEVQRTQRVSPAEQAMFRLLILGLSKVQVTSDLRRGIRTGVAQSLAEFLKKVHLDVSAAPLESRN